MMIEVRAAKGRLVPETALKGAAWIPEKSWTRLRETKWIKGRIEAGDLEIKTKAGTKAPKPDMFSASPAKSENKKD